MDTSREREQMNVVYNEVVAYFDFVILKLGALLVRLDVVEVTGSEIKRAWGVIELCLSRKLSSVKRVIENTLDVVFENGMLPGESRGHADGIEYGGRGLDTFLLNAGIYIGDITHVLQRDVGSVIDLYEDETVCYCSEIVMCAREAVDDLRLEALNELGNLRY